MSMTAISEASLRAAMRDPRYHTPGHPERQAYGQWVTEGWQALARDGHAGGVVHVRAYQRTGRRGRSEHVQSYDRAAPAHVAPTRAWEGQPNADWRIQIAREESARDDGDFGYGRRGSETSPNSTALGRYQINRPTLVAARWQDGEHRWTPRALAHGVRSDADFLANPAAQEAALTDVMRSYEQQLRGLGLFSLVGSNVPSLQGSPIAVTLGGLVAAAHRVGARAVRNYFAHRAAGLPPPPSVAGRGDLSTFNATEARLRAYATTPYQGVGE